MFRGTSNFDRLLEKATSHLLLEPDWATNLLLCDAIRQGDVQAKYAILALKKKLCAPNPHVVLFSLQVLETWIKNCGTPIHQEVASKQFMEELKEIIKVSSNESVKNKILELLQAWAHAFRNEPNYRVLQDTVNLMKVEGNIFPSLKETDAMFAADQAPKWMDGECCHRCRAVFSVVQRKHHCRNCGQVFCAKCTSRNVSIPRFGFEKEVRVCEACWEKLNKPASTKVEDSELPQEYLHSSLAQQPQVPPTKNEQELQEEEDLQLAIALSKSDAENKVKEKLRATSALLSMNSPAPADPVVSSAPTMEAATFESDPELARYLNRSYWEQKQNNDVKKFAPNNNKEYESMGPVPSAPISSGTLNLNTSPIAQKNDLRQNGDVDELDEFMDALRGSLENFCNRMKSNASRGRSIAVDSTIQSFFMNITVIHSQLLKFIQEQGEKRIYYESLQDKLNQARDARAALDALREDHHERLRREAEEAERVRQIQMAQKLEVMRKKKQEYLQYQRQLAMQKMQEQEREMQQKQHQYQMQLAMQEQERDMMHQQQYLRTGPQIQGSSVATGYPAAVNNIQPPVASQPYIQQSQPPVSGPPPGFGPPQLPQPAEGIHPQYQPQYSSPYSAASRPPFQPSQDYPGFNTMGMPNNLQATFPPSQLGMVTNPMAAGMHAQQMQPQLQQMAVVNPAGAPMQSINNPPGVVQMQRPPGQLSEAELISFD